MFCLKSFQKIVLIFICLYVMALGLLTAFQRNFLYMPNGIYQTLVQTGYNTLFEEMNSTTTDGINLHGWYSPATTKEKTIVFFHGNADSIQLLAHIAAPYINEGYGFLLTEYRGYSGIKGTPTENGLYEDAHTFVKELLKRGTPETKLVFFGHSLGTGVATQMALEYPKVAGLMLLSPFTSIPAMAQYQYPIFPARYVVWDRFANDEKLPKIYVPLIIVHGTEDETVPFTQGQALFLMGNNPKIFHAVPFGHHNNLFKKPFTGISLKWLAAL